jgi:hypothetical protein
MKFMKRIILSIALISCLSSFVFTDNLEAGVKKVTGKKSTNDFMVYGKGDTDPYYFYQVYLYNTTTTDEYHAGFSGDNVWTELGQVTNGVYNVRITASGDPGYRFYFAGCGAGSQTSGYYEVNFYGIELSSFCNHITASY